MPTLPGADAAQVLSETVALALEKMSHASGRLAGSASSMSLDQLVQIKTADGDGALERESGKGYDLVFIGIEHPISASADQFDNRLQRLVETFDGPLAIVLNRKDQAAEPGAPLKILVPTGGTPAAGLAIEMALALASAGNGALTVLHVCDPQDDTALFRGRARRQGCPFWPRPAAWGSATICRSRRFTSRMRAQRRLSSGAARAGRYDLVVVGTSLREGATKFLGPRSSALLRNLDSPTLLVTL
jgi:hypothetical protein